ncbi:MAG: 3'-5' exoribonuclease [Kurthia sp.]|nr:3'-5' exoribonuclease [Candidatus Kurthia equi]
MKFEGFSHLFNGVMNKRSLDRMNELQSKEQVAYLRRLEKAVRLEKDFDRPFSEVEFVVVDFETTGFEATKGDEILSIGAVKVKGNKLTTFQFYSLARIQGWIPPNIEQLTSISNKEIANALPLRDVLTEFMRFVGESTLIAHHAHHERSFLETYYYKCFQKKLQHRIVDTSFALKACDVMNPFASLDETCELYEIPIMNRHHALGDAYLTAELWIKLVHQLEERGVNNLEQLYSYFAQK